MLAFQASYVLELASLLDFSFNQSKIAAPEVKFIQMLGSPFYYFGFSDKNIFGDYKFI